MREQVSRFSLYSPLDSLLLEQSDEKMTDGGGSRSQLCSKVKSWGIFVCSRGKIYEDHLRRPRPNTYATGAPPLSIMAHGWKSKGGPTRQVHRSAYHVIYARQRERERKEEHVNGRDVRGPTNHGRGNKERGERERREGRKKERKKGEKRKSWRVCTGPKIGIGGRSSGCSKRAKRQHWRTDGTRLPWRGPSTRAPPLWNATRRPTWPEEKEPGRRTRGKEEEGKVIRRARRLRGTESRGGPERRGELRGEAGRAERRKRMIDKRGTTEPMECPAMKN